MAAFSATIKGMIDEGCAADGVVELPNVAAATLSRVLEHVERHFDSDDSHYPSSSFNPSDDDTLARFDEELVGVDNDTLFHLLQAANFLGIDKLLDLTCKAVAEQMRGRTPDEIREKFHSVNDYTKSLVGVRSRLNSIV
ncbi:SKP1-like protein 4 [Panicum hallii]|jgi:S-phase kinase-associated protein 1|uniref:SKP1-like protein 4 n=1 Tax=Panicum hallii TaxID=206008 RepID=UPI000DF4E5F9|nr:SKP1-like protein 4 [Panicum hallii]